MADADRQKQLKIITAKLKQPRKLIVPDDSDAADFIKGLQKKGREALLVAKTSRNLAVGDANSQGRNLPRPNQRG